MTIRNRTHSRYFRVIQAQLDSIIEKRTHYNSQIVNQLCHQLMQIASYNHVGLIKFEALGWSHHQPKSLVGKWLAQHQQQWFFAQVQNKIKHMAERAGIQTGDVDARWTSQICNQHASLANLSIKPTTKVDQLTQQDVFGMRDGKTFRCSHTNHENSVWQIDSDLNAARNIRLRPIRRLRVKNFP